MVFITVVAALARAGVEPEPLVEKKGQDECSSPPLAPGMPVIFEIAGRCIKFAQAPPCVLQRKGVKSREHQSILKKCASLSSDSARAPDSIARPPGSSFWRAGVSGPRSNIFKWARPDLNRGPPPCEGGILTRLDDEPF